MPVKTTPDFNEKGFRPKFVSEYSMGQLDFIRYDKWLQWVEHWSAQINSVAIPSLEMIQHLFAGLNVLWKNWRPIIAVPKKAEEIDNKIKEVKDKKRIWENSVKNNSPISNKIKLDIVDMLDGIQTKILDIKQIIGFGVPVRKNLTSREKIKAGMRKGKINYLPEK